MPSPPQPRCAGLRAPLDRGSYPSVTFRAMTIKRVGIVGSGIMGSGIAEVAAKSGLEVVLRSRQQATAEAMVASLEKSLAKQVEKGRLDEADRDATLARVTATGDLHDLADCDLVIESVVEDLDVKKELFHELNHTVKDDAILATNTSTLPVVELAMETAGPSRCAASTSSTRRR